MLEVAYHPAATKTWEFKEESATRNTASLHKRISRKKTMKIIQFAQFPCTCYSWKDDHDAKPPEQLFSLNIKLPHSCKLRPR